MFGKPEWFRRKRIGWGLVPITLQGWIYTAIWSAVIGVPFLLLLAISPERWPEALVWMGFSILALTWDVREILRAMRRKEDADLFYIGDDPDDGPVETQNFNLQLRD